MKDSILLLLLFLIFMNGCTDTATPQSQKEIAAQTTIEKNRDDAHKAQQEYLALQRKRARENRL